MEEMNDKLILSRVAAIQRYLETRPESADTLEGIHQNWIRTRRTEDTPEVTRAALEYLEIAGFVESRTFGLRRIWRRTPSPHSAD